jgi:hypothetical protein
MSKMEVINAKITTAVDKTFLVANRAASGAIRIAPGGQSSQSYAVISRRHTDTLHSLVQTGSGTELGKCVGGIESVGSECSDGS